MFKRKNTFFLLDFDLEYFKRLLFTHTPTRTLPTVRLVHLDAAVYQISKPETAHETDCARDQEDAERYQGHVSEVEQVRDEKL